MDKEFFFDVNNIGFANKDSLAIANNSYFQQLLSIATKLSFAPFGFVTIKSREKPFAVAASIGLTEDLFDELLPIGQFMAQPENYPTASFNTTELKEKSITYPAIKGMDNFVGIVLHDNNNEPIGSLCLSGASGWEINNAQREALIGLAGLVVLQIDQANKVSNLAWQASSFFYNTHDGICLIGANYEIMGFNASFERIICQIHGKKPNKDENILNYIEPSTLTLFKDCFARALNGIETMDEIWVPFEGVKKWWEVNYFPMRDGNGSINGVLFTTKDIDNEKRTALALKESENRLKLVLEGTNDAWWDWDLVSGKTFYSPRWWELLGYSLAEYETEKKWAWMQSIHPEDIYISKKRYVYALRNGLSKFETECRLRHINGGYVPFLVRAFISRDNNGRPIRVSGSNMDLTAIKRSEKRFVNLVNDLTFGVVVRDMKGKPLTYNPALLKTLRITKEQLLGTEPFKPIRVWLDEKGKPIPNGPFPITQEVFATLKPVKNRILKTYLPNEGAWLWILADAVPFLDENGRLEHLVCSYIDVSKRMEAEAALQRTENNLSTIFENTDIGYILIDNTYKTLSFNTAANKISKDEYGKSLQQGESLLEFFPDVHREGFLKNMYKVLCGQTISLERNGMVKSGSNKSWYHITYSPVTGGEGRPVQGILVSMENFTERKRKQLELERSYNLISDQNKRLLNFSYIVSHNLRSHTSNIKSIVNFFEAGGLTDAEMEEMVAHLRKATDSLDSTLHNLNEVTAIQSNIHIIKEDLKIEEFIQKAVSVLQDQIEKKNAKIVIDLPPGQTINFNPAYFESIMYNFLSNALKYSHPNREPVITITGTWIENRFSLSIADNGVGIDMGRHGDKIFGMYKTFHGNKDARGIGLFITKNQIEAMEGTVSVSSQVDKGTVFTILFKESPIDEGLNLLDMAGF